MVLRPIATTMAVLEDVGIQLECLREAPRELVRALRAEQGEQWEQVVGDVQDQAQRQRAKARRRRTVPPVELEQQTLVLEPPDKVCPVSGKEWQRIDQAVTTEYDFVPAKLIVRQIIRPKYGRCGQDCCPGVTIAALPPRLLPQSKLGLGSAVFLLLSRFDDYMVYYTTEQNFLGIYSARTPQPNDEWSRPCP